jgi:hypothetical protein
MNPIASSIDNTLNGLPEDVREECITAIRNKRNNAFRNNQQGNTSQNSYSGYQGSNSGQSTNQNKGQKKKNKNSNTSTYESITCWFCNKKGHTQIKCRTRIRQNKPLTWKNKEVKSKFYPKKILVITDFGDMDEAREWRERIKNKAKLPERPTNGQDFQ